jgi:protein-disulfide isomerase
VYNHKVTLGFFLSVATVFSGPSAATDLTDLSSPQRDAFRAEVRLFLLEEPEVLMEAIEVLETRRTEAEARRDAVAITAHADSLFASRLDVVIGNLEGDVEVVEFFDYRCGYCRRAHPEVGELVKNDGEIRLILKELPILGEESLLASRFAIATKIALGVEAYVAMHDALMQMRREFSQTSLIALVDELGLDRAAIIASLEDPLVQATIDYNRLLAQRLSISGTPSFIFGDKIARGYVPLDNMVEMVSKLRQESR